jgi:hypothetical protein
VAVIAPQDALAPEADALERPLRAGVLDVGVRAEAIEAEQGEREMAHERLGLAVGAAAPPRAPEPGADHRTAIAARELAQPDDADRTGVEMLDHEVEVLTALTLRREPREVRPRLGFRDVRAPREPARDRGIARLGEERARVVVARDPHAQGLAGEGEIVHRR